MRPPSPSSPTFSSVWSGSRQRLLRVNAELLYLKNSPVGYSSVPFVVGGNGTLFYANLEMLF